MIEKVMKAVKSSNKRRGRNITIGAVVGFLLSCTAVMGEEDSYLWIRENSGAIEFNTQKTKEVDGSDSNVTWSKENPYKDAGNIWDKDTATKTYTYTNNIKLSSNGANGVYEGPYGPGDNYDMSYGLRLSGDLTNVNFVNNSSIIGIMNDESSSGEGYGIYNSAEMGNIENTGVISGEGSSSGSYEGVGYGIYNKSGTIGAITNTGTISGKGSSSSNSAEGYGIYNDSNNDSNDEEIGNITNITNIKNIGIISGEGSSSGSNGSVSGYGIYNKSGTIEDITNIGVISGSATSTPSSSESYASGKGYGINNEKQMGAITNKGVISGSGAARDKGYGYGYGIYNGSNDSNDSNDKKIGSIINIGIISGYGSNSDTYGFGYGIYNKSGTIGDIANIGIISGEGSSSGSSGEGEGYGIYNDSNDKKMGNITNIGIINGIGKSKDSQAGIAYGIYNKSGTIGDITNIGVISGTGSGSSSSSGYGIYNNDNNEIGNITNIGIISGTGSGRGIYNRATMGSITNTGIIRGTSDGISNESQMGSITNTGVIYGKDNNAIKRYSGDIGASNNYGILVNGNDGGQVVNNKLTIVNATPDKDNINLSKNEILNRGLIFTALGAEYKVETEAYKQFGAIYKDKDIVIGYEKDDENPDSSNPITKKYTIINAKAIESESDMTGINAATEEVNITGTESLKLENGILTYGDSQKEKISSDKGYILNGITDTLKVTKKHNELNDSIINAYETAVVMEGDSTYLELNNTIVNGGLGDNSPVILTKGDKNFLTIKGDTIVNGEIKAEGRLNTLNLYGKENKTRSTDTESMNIVNNITGFGRIQIENDVTFFETAEVTKVERININNGGTLNLRLKKDEGASKATHALSSGNTGLLIAGLEKGGSSTEGTLNFITNGMGTGTIIDMGGAKLENVNLKTNSIVYKFEIVETENENTSANIGDIKLDLKGSLEEIVNSGSITFDNYPKYSLIPDETEYKALDKIYQSSKTDDNMNALVEILDSSSDEEQWKRLLSFLGGIYTETPYSVSSELSRKSMGMFRDIVTENQFKPNLNQWLIMGGLTHRDGGTKDSYYGQNYHGFDTGTADVDVDMKLTGAYALGKYGYSENVSLGVTAGGNRSEAKLPMSKVKGNSGYIGAFAENYRGNLTLKAGAGIQYSEYDADRGTLGGHSYSEKYSDMAYDVYLNGRYSHNIGENLFLEPYGTLSYTYVDQESADEGSKVLAIETDSKSFDYTAAKVGVDIKKEIPHEKGKSTLSAGVSYTRLLTGADEENITGRFKGGSDFDILVAHKNEHSIGLNAKYTLELESGILFDVKGNYSVERDSHNGNGKNRTKGEWIVGAGIGYKF